MIDYFAVYDVGTGAIRWTGSGPSGSALAQQVPDGAAVIAMPFEAIAALPNLDPLKLAVKAQVDAAVGALRRRFITDIPGQSATYMFKEQEARAYLAAADPVDAGYPYLRTEAADTDTTVAALAAEVVATANIWHPINQRLEGRRLGAALAIRDAATIPAIVEAATIDWEVVITPPAD